MKSIITLVVASLLCSCGWYFKAKYEPTTWLFKPGTNQLDAITPFNVTGATVKSPDESGWYLVPSKYYGVWFGRMYGEKNETLAAFTTIHKVEGFESDTDFLNHMVEQRVVQSDATRFKLLRVNNEFIFFKGSACFKYEGLSEDHKNTGIDSSEFQYFNTMGYICRHLYNPIIAFQMEMSYRGGGDTLPEEIRTLGDKFFEDIEFNRQEGLDEIK